MRKCAILLIVPFVSVLANPIELLPYEDSDNFIPRTHGNVNTIPLELIGWFPNEECACNEDDPIQFQLYTTDSMKIWINDNEYDIIAKVSSINPLDQDGGEVDGWGRVISPDNENNGWRGLSVPWHPHYMDSQTPDWREIASLSFEPSDYKKPITGRLFHIRWKIWASICIGTDAKKQLTAEGEVKITIPLPDLSVRWKPATTGLDVNYIPDDAIHEYYVSATNIGGPLWGVQKIGFLLYNRYLNDMNDRLIVNNHDEKPLSASFDVPEGVLEFMGSIGGPIKVLPNHDNGMERHFDSPQWFKADPANEIVESREDNNLYTYGVDGYDILFVQQIETKIDNFPYPFLYSPSELLNNVISSTLNENRESRSTNLPERFHSGVDCRTFGHNTAFASSSGFGNYGYRMSTSSSDFGVIIGDFLYGHIQHLITELHDPWGFDYFNYDVHNPTWYPWFNEGNMISQITSLSNPHIHFGELDHNFVGSPEVRWKHRLNPIDHFYPHTSNESHGIVLDTEYRHAYLRDVSRLNNPLLALQISPISENPPPVVFLLIPSGDYEIIVELKDKYTASSENRMGVFSIESELFHFSPTPPYYDTYNTWSQIANYWLFNEMGGANPQTQDVYYHRDGIDFNRYKITTTYERTGDSYVISPQPIHITEAGTYECYISVNGTHSMDNLDLVISFAVEIY